MKLLEIQKLRAFAVLMVLFGHMPIKLPDMLMHGYTGVSLFFVISGYIVTLTFMKNFHLYRGIYPCVRDFFLRRVFRILPVAILWILIYFVTAQFINYYGGQYGDMERWIKELKWFFSDAYNYYYAISRMPGLFGHYWSLAVEMHFYFFLPFLLVIFSTSKQRVLLCSSAILAISTIFRAYSPPEFIGFFTHTQADALFSGVLLCVLTYAPPTVGDSNTNMRVGISRSHTGNSEIPQSMKNLIFSGMILLLFLLPAFLDNRISPLYKYPVFTALSTAIVWLATQNSGWVLGGVTSIDRFLIWVGDRSYSLYVCHVILYSGLYYFLYNKYLHIIPQWVSNSNVGIGLQTLILLGISLYVSDLSYRYIELPYLNYGKTIIHSMNNENRLERQA